jgi:DNA-binding transcriptional MerR regulator
MPEVSAQVEVPKRALFKAAEVCEIARVQPYVLRSWEAEFPDLGVAKSAGAPRVYRRSDVEQVLRIRHLLLVDGLTLAGARRRLAEEAAPIAAESPEIDELIGQNARERLTAVKRGLQSILDLLGSSGDVHGGEFRLAPPVVKQPARARSIPAGRAKPAPRKVSGSRHASPARAPHARRNRSA